MLKACRYCNKIHDSKNKCREKLEAEERRKEYLRNKKYKKTYTADKFRNTQHWQDVRTSVLKRDYNLCRVCLDSGIMNCSDLSVHHIVPLREDYSKRAELGNLITVCEGHHQLAEAGVYDAEYLRELAEQQPMLK